MDAEIEARAGFSIPQIFRRHGEDGFRDMERRLLRELALPQSLVIATGGGALLDADMRELMGRHGLLVCLKASKEDIRARLAQSRNRPLASDWENLLDARRGAYAQIGHQIMTSGKSPTEIAAEIAALHDGALFVRAPDGGGYPIIIGSGLLQHIGRDAETLGLARHVVIVTNETVAPLYGGNLAQALPNATLIVVPDGEAHKTLDTVRNIYDEMLARGADRATTLVALGGGVIGDTAGFVAATYMRGIPLVQIPTTFAGNGRCKRGRQSRRRSAAKARISSARSSSPRSVIIDTDTLATLPQSQWRCGMAEVVKQWLDWAARAA